MRRVFIVVAGVLLLTVAGVLVAQQDFPNVPEKHIVLENDKVVVQQIKFEKGWTGEHTHDGNQLVVVLKDTQVVYKEDGAEARTVSYEAGDVFWVDAVTHDHQHMQSGTVVLVSLK